jgi:hypothetical protein
MQRRTFGPNALSVMYSAFDDAMRAVDDETTEQNRDKVRSTVGLAVVDLAMAGRSDRSHLANYATYRARMFMDLNR